METKKQHWQLTIRAGKVTTAALIAERGRVVRRTGPLWTLKEFCRRSGKSRRQIYRDIQAGRVRPIGKFLDAWLMEPSELTRLHPPPDSMQSLFPEYDWGTLDIDREAETVLCRVLRFGGRERLRWAFLFYGEARVRQFVREKGARLLDPRSYRYWRLHFGLRPEPSSPKRLQGLRWGGG